LPEHKSSGEVKGTICGVRTVSERSTAEKLPKESALVRSILSQAGKIEKDLEGLKELTRAGDGPDRDFPSIHSAEAVASRLERSRLDTNRGERS
jgi:hypothetical protein